MPEQTRRSSARRASNDGPIQVIDKAAVLLGVLADRQPQSPAELAILTGEPRSSVYRLLNSLSRLEWVQADEDGRYRVGFGLFRLGESAVKNLDVRTAALGPMRQLHETTGETVYLCVRNGTHAVCIERLDGRRVHSLVLRLGGRLPLHQGAAPRVLLANSSDEVRGAWEADFDLSRFEPQDGAVHLGKKQIYQLLQEIRAGGASISDQDLTRGIAAVGAPVFDHRGSCIAAVSISGLRDGILGPEVDMVAAIKETASTISRALGAQHGAG